MKKKGFIITVIVVALVIGGVWFYNGYLYKEARNIGDEKPEFSLTASGLAGDFGNDAAAADRKYLNKTLQVKGTVTAVSDSLLTVDKAVSCGFDGASKLPEVGKAVTVKGRCIGYDELFGEVKLDQCTIGE